MNGVVYDLYQCLKCIRLNDRYLEFREEIEHLLSESKNLRTRIQIVKEQERQELRETLGELKERENVVD